MSGIGRYKLSDALGGSKPSKTGKAKAGRPGKPDQGRETEELRKALDAMPTRRQHMVEIGRGNQQAGRQGGS